jgi:hypothetical protein
LTYTYDGLTDTRVWEEDQTLELPLP